LLAGAKIELRTVLLTDNMTALPILARYLSARLAFVETWSIMQLENIGFARNRWSALHVDYGENFAPIAQALDGEPPFAQQPFPAPFEHRREQLHSSPLYSAPPPPSPPPPPPVRSYATPALPERSAQPAQSLSGRIERFRSIVRRVQLGLLAYGYYQGAIDGGVGPTLPKALQRFHGDFKLPVTGTITLKLLMLCGWPRNRGTSFRRQRFKSINHSCVWINVLIYGQEK
jgi:hypothetical protein